VKAGSGSRPAVRLVCESTDRGVVFRSWFYARIDPQLLALFYVKVPLYDELPYFALEVRLGFLTILEFTRSISLALKNLAHPVFEVLFPLAYLGRRDLVFSRILGGCLFSFEM